jgi:hypothetical protein
MHVLLGGLHDSGWMTFLTQCSSPGGVRVSGPSRPASVTDRRSPIALRAMFARLSLPGV